MLWLLLLLPFIAILIFFKLSQFSWIRKSFDLPWFYLVVGHDLGKKQKKVFLKYKGINGCPDALFKHILLPIYVVGEAKGRKHNNLVRSSEAYQVQLYLGIISKQHFFSSVRGIIKYKDINVQIPYCKKTFNNLVCLKPKAIKALSLV